MQPDGNLSFCIPTPSHNGSASPPPDSGSRFEYDAGSDGDHELGRSGDYVGIRKQSIEDDMAFREDNVHPSTPVLSQTNEQEMLHVDGPGHDSIKGQGSKGAPLPLEHPHPSQSDDRAKKIPPILIPPIPLPLREHPIFQVPMEDDERTTFPTEGESACDLGLILFTDSPGKPVQLLGTEKSNTASQDIQIAPRSNRHAVFQVWMEHDERLGRATHNTAIKDTQRNSAHSASHTIPKLSMEPLPLSEHPSEDNELASCPGEGPHAHYTLEPLSLSELPSEDHELASCPGEGSHAHYTLPTSLIELMESPSRPVHVLGTERRNEHMSRPPREDAPVCHEHPFGATDNGVLQDARSAMLLYSDAAFPAQTEASTHISCSTEGDGAYLTGFPSFADPLPLIEHCAAQGVNVNQTAQSVLLLGDGVSPSDMEAVTCMSYPAKGEGTHLAGSPLFARLPPYSENSSGAVQNVSVNQGAQSISLLDGDIVSPSEMKAVVRISHPTEGVGTQLVGSPLFAGAPLLNEYSSGAVQDIDVNQEAQSASLLDMYSEVVFPGQVETDTHMNCSTNVERRHAVRSPLFTEPPPSNEHSSPSGTAQNVHVNQEAQSVSLPDSNVVFPSEMQADTGMGCSIEEERAYVAGSPLFAGPSLLNEHSSGAVEDVSMNEEVRSTLQPDRYPAHHTQMQDDEPMNYVAEGEDAQSTLLLGGDDLLHMWTEDDEHPPSPNHFSDTGEANAVVQDIQSPSDIEAQLQDENPSNINGDSVMNIVNPEPLNLNADSAELQSVPRLNVPIQLVCATFHHH